MSILSSNATRIADLIPVELGERSGSVFYTGRAAFEQSSRVYILGLNPGGDPVDQAGETIARDIDSWLTGDAVWSAYADESWRGAAPGTWGIQPRIMHMFKRLGLNARDVPASNVVFVRSRDERAITEEKAVLLEACWPVRQAVIDSLGIDTIICLGNTAGAWVREQVRADERFDSYSETNARGWTSEAHRTSGGLSVVTVSHPGRQNWRSPQSDPSDLILRVLTGVRAVKPIVLPRSEVNDMAAEDALEQARLDMTPDNHDWRDDHLSYLHNGDGKSAYTAMRKAEDCGLVATPNSGAVRAVRLHNKAGLYLFSYIVNRAGLLFYVRKPAMKAYPGIEKSFAIAFPEAGQNPAGEWTLPLANAKEASAVTDWLRRAYSG